MDPDSFSIDVAGRGQTTALVYRAKDPMGATFLLAHGAGAGQTHPFMVDISRRLAAAGVDVITFNFLYTERGKKMPDRVDDLEACWRAAIASVRARGGPTPARLFCGGKSMGGRIVSQVAASNAFPGAGLVFLGYPLHPAGKPKVRRDEHLPAIDVPMLFVQGARDSLGTAEELSKVASKLPRAAVVPIEGADHSFAVLKRSGGLTQEEATQRVVAAVASFIRAGLSTKRTK